MRPDWPFIIFWGVGLVLLLGFWRHLPVLIGGE